MIFVIIRYAIYTSICSDFCGGNDRHQTYITTFDEQVSADNVVRIMDAFIEKLDLQKLNFTGTVHKSEGFPRMHPGYF